MKAHRLVAIALVGFTTFNSYVPAEASSLACYEILRAPPTASSLRVESYFHEIYGDAKKAEAMTLAFQKIEADTLHARPAKLREQDLKSIQDTDRVLDNVQYMGYVPFIGSADGKGTFKTMSSMVNYLTAQLGVTMTYILPFLKSPFGDAGFDVQNYREVDAKFGGDGEFQTFQRKLSAHDGSFMMDIIMNHVSVEHDWSKKALSGRPEDAKYRKYFHILDHAPDVVRIDQRDADGNPLLATYREPNYAGQIVEVTRRVIFPMAANKDHPHYVKMKDGNGHDVWVFHTFYPFQFDLNWKNPAVMAEFLKITGHWANQGVDIIRLDAIPFLFKNEESDPRTLRVVEVLREFLAQTAPRTMQIVEANQPVPVVYKYFGDKTKIEVESVKQEMTTSSRGQLAYNFDLMAYTWASLLSGSKNYFIESLQRTPEPPRGAVWGNFLRVHDELSLEMVPEDVRALIFDNLVKTGKGLAFRGNLGVSGRMGDFLGRNPARVSMAFSILLSLRGMPIIYYGDEIMARNDVAYMNKATAERGGEPDTRDANRGPVAKEDFDRAAAHPASPEGQVFQNVRRMIEMRKQRVSMRRGDTRVVETSEASVLAITRNTKKESTLVVQNLSDKQVTTTLKLDHVPHELFDLLAERKLEFKRVPGGIELTLKPYAHIWLAI